jgi:histidine ammonia-lyase
MCAAQAHDLLGPEQGSEASCTIHRLIREVVPTVTEDRFFGDDIEHLALQVFDGTIIRSVEDLIGPLEF